MTRQDDTGQGDTSGRAQAGSPSPLTPDGRYIVVRGRLWRAVDPALSPDRRAALVGDLMDARRSVGQAKRDGDPVAENAARAAVQAAKVALGERGPPWWDDGSPDVNRRMAKNTRCADWYEALSATSAAG
ncbi:hypothetical protein [uncultured Sphingomonas sp.]|uniref:hypothetical protein n=1 Tax=uncultured Sphingomonas sp. TaxID=158754 RepID=UPI0035CBD59B